MGVRTWRMVATSSEARRLALGVQCADSRIVGQPDLLKELKEAVAAIQRRRRPTFIQPMATRRDLTAAGVDVYCRSACGFDLHFSSFTPTHRITTLADILWPI